MKHTVVEISGSKQREQGGYEWGCQIICARALKFLERLRVEGKFPQYATYENITGILMAQDDTAKAMDEYVMQHEELVKYGATGAMHQYGISHAMQIFHRGREEYLKVCREKGGRTEEDFFEFDDAEAFPEEVAA